MRLDIRTGYDDENAGFKLFLRLYTTAIIECLSYEY